MKRVVSLLLALAIATVVGIGSSYAQEEATRLEQVAVDVWPDFDRPADVGEQTLRLPLPPGADVNAVARISPSGDLVTDQITADESTPGVLAVTTASPQIRVEYYVPYQADDEQRQITFQWAADLTVDELVVSVQQPAAATDFALTPAAAEVTTGRDGLTYRTLAPVSLAPGETLQVEGSYRLPDNRLTASVLAEQQPSAATDPPVSESAAAGSDDLNLALVAAVAGAILVAAAAAYLLLSSRQRTRRVVKPRPRRSGGSQANKARPGPASFCHNCGQPTTASDKFCRHCGAELRQS